MAVVSELLSQKGRRVHTIERSAPVIDAIAKMVANEVGSLVVLDRAWSSAGNRGGAARTVGLEYPCGIVTQRDYLRHIALQGRSSKLTVVGDIMSSELSAVEPGTPLEHCLELFRERQVRHLAVMRGSALLGLVSMGDVVRFLAHDREHQIEELTLYIQGRYS